MGMEATRFHVVFSSILLHYMCQLHNRDIPMARIQYRHSDHCKIRFPCCAALIMTNWALESTAVSERIRSDNGNNAQTYMIQSRKIKEEIAEFLLCFQQQFLQIHEKEHYIIGKYNPRQRSLIKKSTNQHISFLYIRQVGLSVWASFVFCQITQSDTKMSGPELEVDLLFALNLTTHRQRNRRGLRLRARFVLRNKDRFWILDSESEEPELGSSDP
ncbi:hypothetical protein YC2023_067256 [Brassica napus]